MDQHPQPASDHGVTTRAIALDILGAVTRGTTLDDALGKHEGLAPLERRDRGFVRMMVATTLRRRGQIDALIGHCIERPLPDSVGQVSDILRLGICQLVVLETPPHAVVDSAVRLTEACRHERHKGLVNAVLRRISRKGRALFEAQDAARLNTPDWLWQSWAGAYGDATCRRIAEAHLVEAPLDITPRAETERWAGALDAELLATGTLRRQDAGGPVAELPGFAEGGWWVQDTAAALAARVLLSALGTGAGDVRLIDLCAAPGGKTAQLAAAGAHVTAVERAPERIALIAENLARLGLDAELVRADAIKWRPKAVPDGVLLDAPCTATGTIRRHPDIAWAKKPADVKRLVPIQDRLLAEAAKMIHSGGILVYSVCSLEPEEGPTRISALLQADKGLVRVPVTPDEIGGLAELITDQGDIRTLPCHLAEQGGMDGFYIARLRRS